MEEKPHGTSAFASGPRASERAAQKNAPKVEPKTSLWEKLQAKTVPSVQFSRSFRTLRDMIQDAEISTELLTKVGKLGEGAFGVVDKCLYTPEPNFQREVAVKRLKPDVLESDLDLQDFVNEALLLKKLSHHNVVEFIGLGADIEKAKDPSEHIKSEHIYLVTEFMNHGSLYSKIVRQMKSAHMIYSMDEGLRWLIDIAKGMKYLHNSNPRVIHRDLKIENVMLTRDSQGIMTAKIVDFGLHALVPAKAEGRVQTAGSKKIVSQTSKRFLRQSQSIKKRNGKLGEEVFRLSGKTGSLMYMAPEVLRSEPYNEKADVFSFSIIMYEVLQKCMLVAFVSLRGIPAEVDQYIASVLSGFRPLIPKEWPSEIKSLLERCWSPRLDDRPSMDEVLEVLVRVQRTTTLPEPEEEPAGCFCCG